MAEQELEAKDFDTIANGLLDKAETQTPEDSSSSNKAEDNQQTDKTAGAEPEKTEQVKAVEADKSLSVEDKLAKIKEILGDDEKALEAYVKEKGYHTDPAWIKQRELIEKLKRDSANVISPEDKKALEDFKKLSSSPEYIQMQMKQQGYTQEAIDNKLKELGHTVPEKTQDDVALVTSALKIDLAKMTPEDRSSVTANISDVASIARVIFQDMLGKILPKELGPLKETLQKTESEATAKSSLASMQETVTKSGVLDFKKDVEPLLHKFMDDYPNCTQADVLAYFKDINHSLTVERLKKGKGQEERDEKRNNLRQNIPISGVKPQFKKSKDFDETADSLLDSLNVH